MTRRQLGNALRVLLRETHYDMEDSAEKLIRMHASGAEYVPPDETPEGRCLAVLTDLALAHRTTVAKIQCGGGKARALMALREEAAWRCRQLTPRPSLPAIARAMGFKDHTSVLAAVRKHAAKLAARASIPTPHHGPAGAGGAPPTALPPPALPAPADPLETAEEGRGGTR